MGPWLAIVHEGTSGVLPQIQAPYPTLGKLSQGACTCIKLTKTNQIGVNTLQILSLGSENRQAGKPDWQGLQAGKKADPTKKENKPRPAYLMYLRKAFDFQRPRNLIWLSDNPKVAAWEAAPIRKLWHLIEEGNPQKVKVARSMVENCVRETGEPVQLRKR